MNFEVCRNTVFLSAELCLFASFLFFVLCWFLLAPAPIFGIKRPRQALLAHPNNYACDNTQPQVTGYLILLVLKNIDVNLQI